MIGQAGRWALTPPTTSLQPKEWNANFWITSNFWWLASQVDWLKPHLLPLSSQNNEMLIFGFHSTYDDQPGRSMDWNPICHTSPGKKWKAHFTITFNFWWSTGLVNGLKPHPPPLFSQKNEMLIFGFRSTYNDQPGRSMDWNPICHPSPGKKWKAHFTITFNFWWSTRQINGLQLHPTLLSSQKTEVLIYGITFNIWWWAALINGLKSHLPPLSSQNNEMLIFALCWTSNDQPGCSMDSNPICHPSPAKIMKCSFLDYIQLLIIS